MARLAATDFGADWVIHSDADEFWWPRGGSLEGRARGGTGPVRHRAWLLAALPAAPGRRRILRRADDGAALARRRSRATSGRVYHAHQKVAHRAHPGVEVERGNHDVVGTASSRCAGGTRSKCCTSRSAPETTRAEGRGGWWDKPRRELDAPPAAARRRVRRGQASRSTTTSLAVGRRLEDGIADGTLAVDTRLRDGLRSLAKAEWHVRATRRGRGARVRASERSRGRAYAAEVSALREVDGIVRAEARAAALEGRADAFERKWPSRLRSGLNLRSTAVD